MEPGHGIAGKVEELSNGVIRVREFFYDGLGKPKVVILLARNSGFDKVGDVISSDLRRDTPYVNETLEFPVPADVDPTDYNYVILWCDSEPLTYGFAKLAAPP